MNLLTTDPQSELFYEVDEQDKVLGSIPRSVAHDRSRRWHRSIAVIVLNLNKTKVLLQKRSLTKDTNPGTWTDSCGGHLTYGESYSAAAEKELQEELGLTALIHEVGKIPLQDQKEREICMVYETTISEETFLRPHTEEVDQLKWVDIDKIAEFLATQPFSTCGRQVIEYYFKLNQNTEN